MGQSAKKKLLDKISSDGLMADPLKDMEIDIQSYDIDRTATVYFDRSGTRCWTKAWFNKREQGERAIEITRLLAIKFINNEIDIDTWLSRYYPKQMNIYHKAIAQARNQLLGI